MLVFNPAHPSTTPTQKEIQVYPSTQCETAQNITNILSWYFWRIASKARLTVPSPPQVLTYCSFIRASNLDNTMCYNRVQVHNCEPACTQDVQRDHCDHFKRYGYCNNSDFNNTGYGKGAAVRQEILSNDPCPKKGHKEKDAGE